MSLTNCILKRTVCMWYELSTFTILNDILMYILWYLQMRIYLYKYSYQVYYLALTSRIIVPINVDEIYISVCYAFCIKLYSRLYIYSD